jgi:hypothetical protein
VLSGRSIRALLLILAASTVFLTSLQCWMPLARAVSDASSIATPNRAPVIHTREEVGDKGVDLSRDAANQRTEAFPEAEPASHPPQRPEQVEVEFSPPHRVLHRRVSPASGDDGVHLA